MKLKCYVLHVHVLCLISLLRIQNETTFVNHKSFSASIFGKIVVELSCFEFQQLLNHFKTACVELQLIGI